MPSNIFNILSSKLNNTSSQLRKTFLKTLGARLFSEANDIKRTRSAIAKELGWEEQAVEDVFKGHSSVEQALQLLSLFVENYPVSLKDLWLDLPLEQGCVIVSPEQSQATSRIFSRPCYSNTNEINPSTEVKSSPYYEYRDTAMAPNAPFRPEWILELRKVADSDPYNPEVIYNKGHLMNQFTFFIGEVNFYWEDKGEKYSHEMNTGDSCHITPFAPHTFASRNPEKAGLIIAVTYGDQIRRANNHLALDTQAQPSYLKEVFQTTAVKREIHSPFNLALRLHFDADLQTNEQLAKQAKITIERLQALLTSAKPTQQEVEHLAAALNLRTEDLYQPIDAEAVELAMFEQTTWVNDETTASRHKALARSVSQPSMKSFIFEVSTQSTKRLQQHAYYQYVYNYSDSTVELTLQDGQHRLLESGSSCYLQPYIHHAFSLPASSKASAAQLLIVRLGGEMNQATTIELSQINQAGRQRLLNETSQWF